MAWRRLPLPWILFSTAVALVAAGVVVLVFDDDSADSGDTADTPELTLTPQGEVPESVQGIGLAPLDGGADQTLGDLLGERPMVLNFFASWCTPCLDEMPDFESVHQDLGDQVSMVGLAENDPPERAQGMVEQTGVTYPTYIDPNGAALTFFEGLALPTTVFLSAEGDVLEIHTDVLTQEQLRDRIRAHFGVEA